MPVMLMGRTITRESLPRYCDPGLCELFRRATSAYETVDPFSSEAVAYRRLVIGIRRELAARGIEFS